MRDLIFALGVLAAAEGLLLALAPGVLGEALEKLRSMPVDRLRMTGLASAAAGVGLLWFARSMGG